jgi:hypothetical protein
MQAAGLKAYPSQNLMRAAWLEAVTFAKPDVGDTAEIGRSLKPFMR